jgi:ubiquinone/menaquinone biosynthesis C-methylase UbiE
MLHEQARRGFGRGAESYERGRPGYPRQTIEWLAVQLGVGPGRSVLDVGAGTGKLTRELLDRGAPVVAVEPVASMRAQLRRAAGSAAVLAGTAEHLPIGDATVDAVTVASAFHWFDATAALREFHRVLRPGGRVAVIWNRRRLDQPLHLAMSEIIDPYRSRVPSAYTTAWREALEKSALFAPEGELMVPFEQRLDVDGLVDRVASISFVAAASDTEREDILARIRRIAEPRRAELALGYVTEAYTFVRSDVSSRR